MNEPRLNLRPMLWFSAAVIGLMLALSAWAWINTPPGAQLPTHWNAAGEVDGYGSKFTALLLLPLTTAGIAALFAVLPRVDPKGDNILRSKEAYRATWIGLLLFMLLVHIGAVLAALGRPIDIGLIAPVGTGLMFVVLGNYLGKIRPNYTFGVRLPWTLASELSWNKTHRLAGRLMMLLGLLIILAALLFPGEAWLAVMLGGLAVYLAVLIVYSYLVWKNDDARRPPKEN